MAIYRYIVSLTTLLPMSMLNNKIFFKAWLTLLVVNILMSCSTNPEPTAPRGKLPDIKTDSPRYTTDQQIISEIKDVKKKLLKKPNDTDLLLQLASLQIEVDQSESAIENLEKLKSLNYTGEPKIYASLGKLYDQKEEYKKARENYLLFQHKIEDNPGLWERTNKIITHLDFKMSILSKPYQINLRPLDTGINTQASEYLSRFTIDGEELIFIRRSGGQEDLFYAKKTDGVFVSTPIDELNTFENEGAHTISADGSLLIFTHCSEKFGYGSCDLYSSKKDINNKWSKPANLGRTINTRHWEAQPSLSPDGNLLFYVSTKPQGSHGGSDIWVSRMTNDGTWSKPRNAGNIINTSERDETPFFHPDGKTLYFRSKGHPSLGNFDIFMSIRDQGGWGEVINIGSPINTSGDDGALTVSLDGLSGYYSTNNYNGEEQATLDIYKFDMPDDFMPTAMTYVKGRITNDEGFPLKASIYVEYLEGLKVSSNYKSNANGEFLTAIPVGIPALINVESDGYIFYSDHVNYTDTKYGVDPYNLEIVMTELAPEETNVIASPVILKNIFFESGSATLLEISNTEINILKELLIKNEDLRIKIIGHTDDVGDEADNLILSQARAEAVKTSLVQMEIASSRIETQGLGESLPIASNQTEEGRSANRRTEFVIIK